MSATKAPHTEPIPGYRLIEPLGSGGFGEVWKCEAPGGLFKAIKFVYGDLNGLEGDAAQAEEELRAVERIKAIRHPFLLSMDRVECVDGELMIVTELADRNLHDLLQDRRKAGLPGIARDELLGYLREAAEVLDLMNLQHGLQHLDVKPRNLFLVSNHVKVADFGLVNSLGAGAEGNPKLGAITPLYAAPEVFHGKISPRSDQYSLAVAYQELLTGTLPFQAKNSRKMLLLHTQGKPNLSALPEADRTLVARALAKDPEERFPSCMAFVRALESATKVSVTAAPAAAPEPPPPAPLPDFASAETVRRSGDTDAGGPRHAPPTGIAALAGYEFQESLGCTPLADVWAAQRPDGRACLVHQIYGLGGRDFHERDEFILRFKALQHPALNATEVVQCDRGRVVLVSDHVGQTVRDRWQQCQGQRLAGIPRVELLDYLHTAAEALDYLYQQHAVHHLTLNPRNLLLNKGRLQLAEFGLAHLFWVPANQPIGPRNGRYAAPELFEGQVSRACDQYSLALIYQELLTGTHPFRGRSRLPAAAGQAPADPDLKALPAPDRAAIARALDPDPAKRWPCCLDLVRALEGQQQATARKDEEADDPFIESVRRRDKPPAASPASGISQDALNQILLALLGDAGGDGAAEEEAPGPNGDGDGLRQKFRAGLPIGAAREQLDAFRRHWDGRLLRDTDEAFAFEVIQPANFWTQWIGRPPALEVQVQLSRPHALSATPIDVTAEVRVLHCSKKRAAQLLDEVGAPLLESLRTHLLVNSEKRTQDRLVWPYSVEVRCVLPDGKVSDPIECRGKDISLSGIGFYLPHEIPTAQVSIQLPTASEPPYLEVPATLVRARRCADGWYDVGALFRIGTLRKSQAELKRPKLARK